MQKKQQQDTLQQPELVIEANSPVADDDKVEKRDKKDKKEKKGDKDKKKSTKKSKKEQKAVPIDSSKPRVNIVVIGHVDAGKVFPFFSCFFQRNS